MITDHVRFSAILFPSEWGKPLFHLGQAVRYGQEPAMVTGLHWVATDSRIHQQEDVDEGWWYEVTYTTNSRYARVMSPEYLHESLIQPVEPESNPNRTEFDRIIHTEPLGTLA